MLKKLIVGLFLCLLVLAIGLYAKQSQNKNNATTPSPTPTSELTGILGDAAIWWPSVPWTTPKVSTMTTQYGTLSGAQIQATTTANIASLSPFEDKIMLSKMGFIEDTNLAAAGAGSAAWGYKKVKDNESQILLFSYTTKPTSSNPNEPLQFNCPCSQTVTVFVSNLFTAK